MNAWLLAAAVLLVCGLAPALAASYRGDVGARLAALQVGGVITAVILLLLAKGFDRPVYVDLGLMLALLAFVGSLVFARFLERWL